MILHPLDVVGLTDINLVWKPSRRQTKPELIDVVVLHPELAEILTDHKPENNIMVATHATVGGIHYIQQIATLSDKDIVSAVASQYSVADVEAWLRQSAENNIPPYLKDADAAIGGSQLRFALEDGITRVIAR